LPIAFSESCPLGLTQSRALGPSESASALLSSHPSWIVDGTPMTIHISRTIILRIKDFGESDLLVGFFALDKGRLKGVARGGRRSRKRFVNCLDLFCLVNLEYELEKRGDLHLLHSCRLINGFPGLRTDFGALSLASYMVELTETLFPEGVVDPDMFLLMETAFQELNEGKERGLLRVRFEARAMALGGYGIDLTGCLRCGRSYTAQGNAVFLPEKGGICCLKCRQVTALSPGLSPKAAQALRIMQAAPWEGFRPLVLEENTVREIATVLKMHMDYRLGKRPRSGGYLV
jgi:DNA repair protein RecO (recombination protein O)